MFIIFAIAVAMISAIALGSYITKTAPANAAYGNLVYAAYYVIEVGNGGIPQGPPPDAFMSTEGLTQTLSGVWTTQYLGLALILLFITLILVVAYAYARALTLGLVHDAMQGKPQNLFSMFRAAREYWRATIWYVLPFALLVWITLVAALPLWLRDLGLDVLGGANVHLLNILLISFIVFSLVLAAITIFAEGVIVAGSRKPLRESAVAASAKPLRALGAITLCTIVAGVFIVLDYCRTLLAQTLQSTALSVIAFIVLVLLAAAWRMWAAAFAMHLWPAGNRTTRTPRGE